MQLNPQRRHPNALLRLGDLSVLLAVLALSLTGCGSGPDVENCIVDGHPTRLAMDCATRALPQGYTRTQEAAENYICTSPWGYERLLKACVERRGTVVSFCIVDGHGGMDCALSDDPNEDGYHLTWMQAGGYVCTSPEDLDRLLKWCTR